MKISIELVPRDEEYLVSELEKVADNFPEVNIINIPDLTRFSVRSWEGCKLAKNYFDNTIPHLRAIDFNYKESFVLKEYLLENNINEVLVVTGDPVQELSKKVYPSTSIDIIKKIKKEIPGIKVYAGIDQYRQSIRKEVEYINRKAEAGADGFFTQPFFDLRLLEIYAELLEEHDVYWGISPVTSEKSVLYWETKNNAIFSKDFKPTLEWNISFAKKALEFTKANGDNIYFMPIRMDTQKYLDGIFNN